MKEITLLTWMTQLGLSVVAPLVGWILLALWLRNSHGWGDWVLWCGIILGVLTAIDGFIKSMKQMNRQAKGDQAPESHPISFNDHD